MHTKYNKFLSTDKTHGEFILLVTYINAVEVVFTEKINKLKVLKQPTASVTYFSY
jgi:uncharacterized protein YktA (UPF0223 family)